MIDSFVNAVYLFDNKMLIIYNYKDGSETVSLDEVNSSDLGASGALMRFRNKCLQAGKPTEDIDELLLKACYYTR